MIDDGMIERRARKRHRCERQARYDRILRRYGTLDAILDYGATQCPEGGWIEIGTLYAESEGWDEFHPTREHLACYAVEASRVLGAKP